MTALPMAADIQCAEGFKLFRVHAFRFILLICNFFLLCMRRYIYIYVYVYIYMPYVYIYIYRERERDGIFLKLLFPRAPSG